MHSFQQQPRKADKPQGCRRQSPDGQAQLDVVGGEAFNNSRAKRATKICTLVFSAVRRRSHCTSASNIGACRAEWVPGQNLVTPHLMRNCGSALPLHCTLYIRLYVRLYVRKHAYAGLRVRRASSHPVLVI